MNGFDFRTSQSSYGDPRHYSATSVGPPQPPPSKVLLDGYQNNVDGLQGESPRYNPLNPTHPRSSALLNANDPVTMYLLTETAMGDSAHYEILSLEEVESLKKEHKFLAGRMDGAKRKLALEMKLRDAASSLNRLYGAKSPRGSEEYAAGGSPKSHRRSGSIFGRTPGSQDKADEELAVSSRKCDELAHEIWSVEGRVATIHRRLLEHTAGVLQLTHKGLKKNPKNNIPHTPESLSSHNTQGSVDEFDDRSLYRPFDPGDEFGYARRAPPVPADPSTPSAPSALGLDAVQSMERRLEELSARMRDQVSRSNPDSEFHAAPLPADRGSPTDPTAGLEAHLAYITSALGMIHAHPPPDATPTRGGDDGPSVAHLGDLNARIFDIVAQSGLPHSQTLPPPPEAADGGVSEQLAYLGTGLDGLQRRIEGLLDQKSILTTQIQQQRELNSKSDAERDAHIGDLVEQLAHVRKDLEGTERDHQRSQDEMGLVVGQLEAVRRELSDHQQRSVPAEDAGALSAEKDARAHAEAELVRLQAIVQELERDRAAQAEAHEARLRAESEVARLESDLEALRSQPTSDPEEMAAVRAHADGEIQRLQGVIDQLHSEADARAEEAAEARERSEQQMAELEAAMQQIRSESDARVRESMEMRAQAEGEVAQLQASMEQLRSDIQSQLQEATDGRTRAEADATHLQTELTQMEGEVARLQTELTMAKAELDGAYGSRSERAAAAANSGIQEEIDALNTRNLELMEELAGLKAGKPGGGTSDRRVQMLEKELRETVDDYESMTKASIEFEKERERFEGVIDSLRDRCEQLETQINEERIQWMGIHHAPMSRDGTTSETTSTMVLKNEFKKMMRDTRIENMRILKAEQEERRRLENLIRSLKKEQANAAAAASQPTTPGVAT
ncbi:involucrin repeat protein [Aspergillus candidus]|uniref:Up-regulated during septation-domain-containing protein n=1 Tax=Aspergillus candidus TaxID=41067 RepID=A0A2I2F3B1_ASPCN|nr:Up-regulated during septation-domain-containing protein [Aspergillus candidus]PLB35132.1 Up-regulated during septation-domain-containing protein [Aspergillus candidus]